MYDAQWALLTDLKAAQALPSFWMFVGGKGCGKAFFAQKWIRYFVRCHDIACDPRVCLIQTEGEIGIEPIQKVFKFLSQKSEGQRFVLIDNAERMNRFAQNALLKTFETAYVDTMVILIVHHIDALLPTMISRFHRLNFSLTPDDIAQNLQPLIPYAGPSLYYLEKLSALGGIELVHRMEDMLETKRCPDEWIRKNADHAADLVFFLGHILYQHCLLTPTPKNMTCFERVNRFLSDIPGAHLRDEDILRTAMKLAV